MVKCPSECNCEAVSPQAVEDELRRLSSQTGKSKTELISEAVRRIAEM